MPIQNIFESIRPEFIFSSDTPRQAQMKPSSQYMYWVNDNLANFFKKEFP